MGRTRWATTQLTGSPRQQPVIRTARPRKADSMSVPRPPPTATTKTTTQEASAPLRTRRAHHHPGELASLLSHCLSVARFTSSSGAPQPGEAPNPARVAALHPDSPSAAA
jgi:hypothetical protein